MAAGVVNDETAVKAQLARSLRMMEPIYHKAVQNSVTASTLLQALRTRPRISSQTGADLPGNIAEMIHGKVITFREDIALLIEEMNSNERTIVSVLQSLENIYVEIRDCERNFQEKLVALISYLLIVSTEELNIVRSNTALSWMFSQIFPGLNIHAGH